MVLRRMREVEEKATAIRQIGIDWPTRRLFQRSVHWKRSSPGNHPFE
jgi:hypothetical protein